MDKKRPTNNMGMRIGSNDNSCPQLLNAFVIRYPYSMMTAIVVWPAILRNDFFMRLPLLFTLAPAAFPGTTAAGFPSSNVGSSLGKDKCGSAWLG